MTPPLFKRVAIIGLGLIGSSIAHALKRRQLAGEIVGTDSNSKVRGRAREIGFADRIEESCSKAVADAELIILSIPIGAVRAVVREIADDVAPGAIITDVGSTKRSVIRDVQPALKGGVTFVPGHPIAGTEQSGPDAGFADLFEGRWCILTPEAGADPAAVERVTAMWQALGSEVEFMTPDHHDLVLAITSHVPHLIAYNIVGTAADLEEVTRSEVIKFSAGGFRDFTRIAASDPVMWRDVFMNNKDAVLETLGRFSEDLSALQRAIRWDDGDALLDLFTRTRDIRRSIIEAGQETEQPDFGRKSGAAPEPSMSGSPDTDKDG